MVCIGCFLYFTIFLLSLASVAIFSIFVILKQIIKSQRNKRKAKTGNECAVGIFHPYCNAGGGGERVLWCAVKALQNKYPNVRIVIYTGDTDATGAQILSKARTAFNIAIDTKLVEFVFLHRRKWVEAERYPHFTLLGQSLGSIVLAMEAILKYQPDIYIDTMGYAFTFPVFHYLGDCKVGCYVHYPTISTDMLRRVQNRTLAQNNQSYVVKNPFLTWFKLFYYKMFARIYGKVGRYADTVMANSTWTENHIINLWNVPYKTHRVYPPCETGNLTKLESSKSEDKIIILSVGQYRPEKDHPLQLQAMYELRTLLNDDEALWNKVKLLIVGSCRNDEDMERVKNMQDLSKHLSLENSVEFRVNVSYQELLECYKSATVGLHAMWNEHFGISVVDCMAAGLIMVANRSGGPLMDIVETSDGSQTGYLAVDAVEYARCIAAILYNTKEYNNRIINAARASVDRFSEKEFDKSFLYAVAPLFE